MSTLDQPAFPGGQMQSLETDQGKMHIPNYSGFTKRECLHVIGALAIYTNDDKMQSLHAAAGKYGTPLEDLMVKAIHGFVDAVERSINSKGENNEHTNANGEQPSTSSDRPSQEREAGILP